MPKSIKEFCEDYFRKYNSAYQYRDAWLEVREVRYEQIRDNDCYLDEGAEVFKKEVLRFWEGRGNIVGYNYGDSYLRNKGGKWILFQNQDGETPCVKEILKNIKDFDLYGNYSWSNLQMGGDITKDMTKLKKTVNYLLDEKIDIVERFNNVVSPDGKYRIEGMSNGKATIFLHMAYPNKYGVWNGPVNKAFQILGRVDERFRIREPNLGEKYKKINNLLKWLRDEYSSKKYKNGFENLSDVDIFVWYVADKF